MLRSLSVDITVDANGDAVSYVGKKVTGKIWAIAYDFVDFGATVDFTIVGETTGLPVLAVEDVAQADKIWHPRILPDKHTDGAAFTDVAAEPPRVCAERIQITTTDGGNKTSGTLTFYIEDESYVAN